jgi:hypothetical protein
MAGPPGGGGSFTTSDYVNTQYTFDPNKDLYNGRRLNRPPAGFGWPSSSNVTSYEPEVKPGTKPVEPTGTTEIKTVEPTGTTNTKGPTGVNINGLGGNSGDPTKDVGFGDFFKASDDVGKLTPEEQAEAERILTEQGSGEFARYVAEKSVKRSGVDTFDENTLRSSVNSLKAFEGGGFQDFYRIADLESIINDPATSAEDRSKAEAERDDLLANPTEGANSRTIADDPAGTNLKLNQAIKAVQAAGASGDLTGAEEIIGGLGDPELVKIVTTLVKEREDLTLRTAHDYEQMLRDGLLAENIVEDAGYGITYGGIAQPPPVIANDPVRNASWYLNQAMARARHGIINNDTKAYLKRLLDQATGGGDDGVRRLEEAWQQSMTFKQEAIDKANAELNKTKAAELEAALLQKQKDQAERDRLAKIESDKFTKTRSALDKLLSGQDLSSADFDGLDQESITRIEALRTQTLENEIKRREAVLQDRADNFKEARFQRGAFTEERDRTRGINENLTTDVATPGTTPGAYDRVLTSYEKADRGIMPTESELFDLTADQRAQLQNYAIQRGNQLKIEEANGAIQLDARQRLLNPNSVGSGAQVFGQGNANQFYGRNAMSGIEQRIAEMASEINVNADTQRAAEKQRINTQIDQAQEKLARVFANPATGGLSGAAQRRFEELEAGRASALNEIDTRVDAQVREETRTNMGTLLGLQQSREGASVAANQVNQGNLAQILGFAGAQDQLGLARGQALGNIDGQNTLARDQYNTATSQGDRGLDLQDRAQRDQTRLAELDLFGGAEGTTAAGLGIDVGSIVGPDMQLKQGATMDQLFTALTQIGKGFAEQYGREPNAAEMTSLLTGGTAGRRQTLAGRAQNTQDELAFGDRLGYMNDPQSGVRTQTLAGRAEARSDGQLSETVRQFNAQFFGDAVDPETGLVRDGVDRERFTQDMAQFNRQMELSERELLSTVQQTWAQITGETGPGPINADDLGIDISGIVNSPLPPQALLQTAEGKAAATAFEMLTGKKGSTAEILSILQGETLQIDGAPTLAAKEMTSRITQANMDRATAIDQFAKDNNLQWAQVNKAFEESDRQWALTTQDVASITGVDEKKWLQARNEWELAKEKGLSDVEARNRAMQRSGMSETDFTQTNKLFEERFGLAERKAAIDAGMSKEQWDSAKKSKEKMELREAQYWNGIMGGRGSEITLRDLIDTAPIPDDLPDDFKSVEGKPLFDKMSATIFGRNKFKGGDAKEGQDVLNGVMNFIAKDPIQAMDQLERMFMHSGDNETAGPENRQNISGTNIPAIQNVDQAKLESKGFNRAIARAFDNGGKDTSLALVEIINMIQSTSDETGYRGINIGAMDDKEILEMMNGRYGDQETPISLDQINRMRLGEPIRVVPENWIESFNPVDRAEILSLIHGGTSFQIAQQQPSLGQTIGGFAGAAAAGYIGSNAGAAAIGSSSIGRAFKSIFG